MSGPGYLPEACVFAERHIRVAVAEAVDVAIAAHGRRSQDPLRRRFLDETRATASPIAIQAAIGRQ